MPPLVAIAFFDAYKISPSGSGGLMSRKVLRHGFARYGEAVTMNQTQHQEAPSGSLERPRPDQHHS